MQPRPLNRLEALKGVAIVIFMFYHFRVLAWGDEVAGGAYGRAAVGMFFLISGFGLAHSLARRLDGTPRWISALLVFWRDRAVRIYPQYWVAVALTFVVYNLAYSWWQWLGADSPYWFISQVLQCYLVAPALHVLARSRHWLTRLLPLAVFALANAWAYAAFGGVPDQGLMGQFAYQGALLTHVVLFYFGMLWARHLAARVSAGSAAQAAGRNAPGSHSPGALPEQRGGPSAGLLMAAGYTAMMVLCVRSPVAWLNIASTMGFLGASFAMFAGFLGLEQLFPGCRVLAFLGKYSLSIYLFEPFFYFCLYRLRLLEIHHWMNVPWYLGTLPLFFCLCVLVQRGQDAVLKRALPRH